jgi:hypothetical protein
METLFRSLMDQPGIHAAMVVDSGGQLLAFQGGALYDRAMLDGVSATLARALDSIDLLHADWDEVQVQFGDGSLMIRNLGAVDGQAGRAILAVVTDTSFNRSFVTVAMRVVVQKLKQALSASSSPSQVPGVLPAYPLYAGNSAISSPARPGAASHPGSAPPLYPAQPAGSALGAPPPKPSTSAAHVHGAHVQGAASAPHQSDLSSRLSWSGLDNAKSSGVGVAVADEPSSKVLSHVSKQLANYVGPMAKILTKEAVRKVCQDEPFSKERLTELVTVLASHIEDPAEAREFVTSMRSAT